MIHLAVFLEPLDVITLSEALEARDQLDTVGGLAFLAELARNTPSASNIRAYADIVRERATLRPPEPLRRCRRRRTVSSTIDSPGRRFFTMLGTLVQGRVARRLCCRGVEGGAVDRHPRDALQRRQFNQSSDEKEELLLDYRSHQRRRLCVSRRPGPMSHASASGAAAQVRRCLLGCGRHA